MFARPEDPTRVDGLTAVRVTMPGSATRRIEIMRRPSPNRTGSVLLYRCPISAKPRRYLYRLAASLGGLVDYFGLQCQECAGLRWTSQGRYRPGPRRAPWDPRVVSDPRLILAEFPDAFSKSPVPSAGDMGGDMGKRRIPPGYRKATPREQAENELVKEVENELAKAFTGRFDCENELVTAFDFLDSTLSESPVKEAGAEDTDHATIQASRGRRVFPAREPTLAANWESLRLATVMGMGLEMAPCHLGLGRFHRLVGEDAGARHLEEPVLASASTAAA